MDNKNKNRAKLYAQKLEAYKNVFTSVEGEKVLQDMMEVHSFLDSTFKGDVNKMLIHEGERNVILRILSIMKMDIKSIYERIDRETQTMG